MGFELSTKILTRSTKTKFVSKYYFGVVYVCWHYSMIEVCLDWWVKRNVRLCACKLLFQWFSQINCTWYMTTTKAITLFYKQQLSNERTKQREENEGIRILCVYFVCIYHILKVSIRLEEVLKKKNRIGIVKTKACIFRLVNVAKNLKCSWIHSKIIITFSKCVR